MTIRQYATIFIGAIAISLGLSLITGAAHAAQIDGDPRYIEDRMDWAEAEPDLTGFHEVDDVPSYMAADRPQPEPLTYAVPMPRPVTEASMLQADGPAGLSWSILVRLALLSVLFLAVALYGGRSNA